MKLILNKSQIKEMKKGAEIEMHNSSDGEGDIFNIFFNKKWSHFCIQKNGLVIKACKGIKPIIKKLEKDGVIEELTTFR